jgi:putative phosphoesterase
MPEVDFMKVAFIADIHANIYALIEVLRDIEERNIENIYCLGDLVGYMPFPNEVIELIRNKKIPAVQGNYDESVAEDLLVCGCDYKNPKDMELASKSLLWTQQNTSLLNKEYLKSLPEMIELNIEGRHVLLVHGSPRKNNEYLYENSQELKDVAVSCKFDVLVCGHTHVPYYKVLNGKHIINAGSAGKPKHMNPNATYAIADIEKGSIKVEIIEVPYDYEKTAKAIEDSTLPDEFAELIRKG